MMVDKIIAKYMTSIYNMCNTFHLPCFNGGGIQMFENRFSFQRSISDTPISIHTSGMVNQ